MKKLLAVLLAGTMALSLTACGGSTKGTEAAATNAAVETDGGAAEAADTKAADEAAESAEASGELTGRLKAIKEAGVLKVATSPDYPPYEFEDITKDGQEKYVGADMELAKYIADKLGVKLQIEAMAFDACMAAIGQGRVDLTICGMVPKEERKTTMDFSDVYYNDGNQVIVILKEDADKYKTLADFAGKSIAAQNGTLQYDLVTTQIPDAKCEVVSAVTDGIMMLKTGKVAGIALASVAADNYLANYPDLVECDEKFDYTSLGVVAGVVKNEPEFLAEINGIVKEVVDSEIYYQWIDEASQLSNEIQGVK